MQLCVFLDVHKFFYNKKNISKVFPLLSFGLRSIQVSIIYFLIFFLPWVNRAKDSLKFLPSPLSTILSYFDPPPPALVLWLQYLYGSAYIYYLPPTRSEFRKSTWNPEICIFYKNPMWFLIEKQLSISLAITLVSFQNSFITCYSMTNNSNLLFGTHYI